MMMLTDGIKIMNINIVQDFKIFNLVTNVTYNYKKGLKYHIITPRGSDQEVPVCVKWAKLRTF